MKTVTLDGEKIPCKDIRQIQKVYQNSEVKYEVKYDQTDPETLSYEQRTVRLDEDKGYKVELTVRRAMLKTSNRLG